MGRNWLDVPRDWIAGFGAIASFGARVVGEVLGGRVFRFLGETLRQAGILIFGSTAVILGLAFILGLTCGLEGAYFSRSVGAPANAGVFAAWCDLREVIPYAWGYMLSAKIGTGLVAEIGAMRITDEIDALEVMGISSMTFLCATRLLAAFLVFPFVYMAAIGAGFLASYIAVVEQIAEVSQGGFFLIFWQFQNPPDVLFSLIKAMAMGIVIVIVGTYYGYTAGGGPVGVGTATAKSMVLNTVLVHIVGMLGTQIFWGQDPRAPIGGWRRRREAPAAASAGCRTIRRMAQQPARRRRTREESRAETRRLLLDAAATVFVRRGFQGASVEEITAEAGFTRGAFYSNFESKEQMFVELLHERVYRSYTEMLERVPTDATPLEQVRWAGRDLMERYRNEEDQWLFELWLECLAHAVRHPDFASLAAGFWSGNRRGLAAQIEQMYIDTGASPPLDPKAIATAVIAIDIGLKVQHLVDPEAVPLELYPILYEALFGPMVAPPEPK